MIANLSASPPGDHPRFVSQLMARLAELRDQTGRPQFILMDRADGVLLEGPDTGALPSGLILATGAPDRLPPRLRASVSVVLAAGEQSAAAIDGAATALSRAAPRAREVTLAEGEALVWPVAPAAAPFPIRLGADTGSPAATSMGDRRRRRQLDDDGRAGVDITLQRDVAAVGLHDQPRQPQPQPDTWRVRVQPREGLKDALVMLSRDAAALVAHHQARGAGDGRSLDANRPATAVNDRVRQQVGANVRQPQPNPTFPAPGRR